MEYAPSPSKTQYPSNENESEVELYRKRRCKKNRAGNLDEVCRESFVREFVRVVRGEIVLIAEFRIEHPTQRKFQPAQNTVSEDKILEKDEYEDANIERPDPRPQPTEKNDGTDDAMQNKDSDGRGVFERSHDQIVSHKTVSDFGAKKNGTVTGASDRPFRAAHRDTSSCIPSGISGFRVTTPVWPDKTSSSSVIVSPTCGSFAISNANNVA